MASPYVDLSPITIGPCSDYSAGDAADNIQAFRARRKVQVVSVYVTVSATIAADAADYVTIILTDGTNTIATLDTTATALTADTPRAMTVTPRLAMVDADTNLYFTITQAGSTGVAVADLQFDIAIRNHEHADQRT